MIVLDYIKLEGLKEYRTKAFSFLQFYLLLIQVMKRYVDLYV